MRSGEEITTNICKIINAVDEVNAELLFIIPYILELGGGRVMEVIADWVKVDKRASSHSRVVNPCNLFKQESCEGKRTGGKRRSDTLLGSRSTT